MGASDKKLLMLNGGYNEVPLIKAAKLLGYHVVTSGNDPTGPGHRIADENRFVDYSDRESVLALAQELEVDAICSASNDFSALSAAYAAEQMGLPGHDRYETSRAFHEKDEFRRVAGSLGLCVPAAASFDDAAQAKAHAQGCKLPLLVKPADLSGGKGISLLRSRDEAGPAIDFAMRLSKVKRVVLEEYVTGTQHGYICYVKGGKVAFDTSTNDYSAPSDPWLVGSSFGHDTDEFYRVRSAISQDVERLVGAMGAADGFLTIQYIMNRGRPCYIETMRRCLGNLHFLALSEETGVDWCEWFVQSQAGCCCDGYLANARLGNNSAGFLVSFAPRDGTISSVSVDSEFMKQVFHVETLLDVGERVENHATDKQGIYLFRCSKDGRDKLAARRDELVKVQCK